MPWGTMILVCGVGVLMNLVVELGGIDLLSSGLASIMTEQTAAGFSGLTAGILSLFSSTLGVVLPTLIPTVGSLIAKVGAAVTPMELCAAIGFASSTSGISPASTAGALTMGAMTSDPEFAEKFETVISIPVFTNDELVTFARTYARENGFRMDEMGVLALYTMIGDNQKEDEPITIGKVKEMVDGAIRKASGVKLGRKLSKRHTDADGRILLYEKDFDL